MLLCLGEFTVADFQNAYMALDDEFENTLSKSKQVLRVKKRWALDELRLQPSLQYNVCEQTVLNLPRMVVYGWVSRSRMCCSRLSPTLGHIGEELASATLVGMRPS